MCCHKQRTCTITRPIIESFITYSSTIMGIKVCSQPPIHSILFFLLLLLALIFKSEAGDIVMYWGQNGGEKNLTETCASGNFTIVNIAFLSYFGGGQAPGINLAGHCDPAHNGCQTVGNEIKYCQNQSIKVMLTIGGSGGGYNLTSDDDARSVADQIWNSFLGGQSNDTRPLGDAVLDGIDFYIHQGDVSHYATLAQKLAEYSQQGKKVYLSATPECQFPDNWMDDVLETGLFDYVWVQFYYNPECEYTSDDPSKFKNSWDKWTSSIQATKFFVGLPASPEAASGYVEPDTLISEVIPMIKASPKYGGVMLWNKYADEQTNYSALIHGNI